MIKSNLAQQKLFFVCPFCHMENFIRNEYGDVYFITAPAAVFNFTDDRFAKEMQLFLLNKSITDLYIVCDLNCDLINNTLAGGSDHGLACERVLQRLVHRGDQPFSLAEKLIHQQVNNIKTAPHIADVVNEKRIKIHGIVSSRHNRRLIPVTYVNDIFTFSSYG